MVITYITPRSYELSYELTLCNDRIGQYILDGYLDIELDSPLRSDAHLELVSFTVDDELHFTWLHGPVTATTSWSYLLIREFLNS